MPRTESTKDPANRHLLEKHANSGVVINIYQHCINNGCPAILEYLSKHYLTLQPRCANVPSVGRKTGNCKELPRQGIEGDASALVDQKHHNPKEEDGQTHP